jgi:small subunit ribosomal protein S1
MTDDTPDAGQADEVEDELAESLPRSLQVVRNARVIRIDNDVVSLDIGSKFESVLALSDWREDDSPPKMGDVVSVLIEDDPDIDDRPLRIARVALHTTPAGEGRKFLKNAHPGDIHTGRIVRRIRGGFIVDIGVLAFLPEEHATGARRAGENALIGQIGCWRISKIDLERLSIEIVPFDNSQVRGGQC